MPRRQRQRDEVCELCQSGAVARAVDLAFQHFADFGRDDDVLELLAAAVERTAVSDDVRRRYRNLREAASAGGQCSVSAPAHDADTTERKETET